jgi:hypothetical protein
MIQVSGNDIQIVKHNLYYDIAWSGLCKYNNKLYKFKAIDKTDYEQMQADCPYCSDVSDDVYRCQCQSFVDVVYELEPLSLKERIVNYFT